MRAATLLITPYIIIWLLTRSRRSFRWLLLTALLTVQLISLLPLAIVAYTVTREPEMASGEFGEIYSRYRIVNASMHGAPGWQGIDIAAGCGEPIYAPFAGQVTENHIDHQGNTTLTILGDNGYTLMLLHGDYVVQIGDNVRTGQLIGTENKTGYFVGAAPICHSHVILKQNGRMLNWLEYEPVEYHYAGAGNVGSTFTPDYPLRISWYDPSLGGTNCDHDCTTMASGDKVQSWIGGRGGIYAAACPRSDGWHHGKRFELDGVIYECRDTGGWINCYQPGMYDPALKRQADSVYCWVDLLNNSSYGYGNLAHNWSMIR